MHHEEIFDVVNNSDRVIGRLPRSVVHRRNLYHRSVHGVVVDSANRVFLQLRAPHKDCDPGLWDTSVAGHLEAGERYDQAIIRETLEELGIRLRVTPKRLFKLDASSETNYEFCWVYLIRDNGPIQVDRSETVDGKWFVVDELSETLKDRPQEFTGSIKVIWQQLIQSEHLNE